MPVPKDLPQPGPGNPLTAERKQYRRRETDPGIGRRIPWIPPGSSSTTCSNSALPGSSELAGAWRRVSAVT